MLVVDYVPGLNFRNGSSCSARCHGGSRATASGRPRWAIARPSTWGSRIATSSRRTCPVLAGWRGQGDRLGARSRPPRPWRVLDRHRPVPGNARLLRPGAGRTGPRMRPPSATSTGSAASGTSCCPGSPPFHGNRAAAGGGPRRRTGPRLGPPRSTSPTPSSTHQEELLEKCPDRRFAPPAN